MAALPVNLVLGLPGVFMIVEGTEAMLARYGRWLPTLTAPLFALAHLSGDMRGRSARADLLKHEGVRHRPLLRWIFVRGQPRASLRARARWPELGDFSRALAEVAHPFHSRLVSLPGDEPGGSWVRLSLPRTVAAGV